jgi:hypothetical protein
MRTQFFIFALFALFFASWAAPTITIIDSSTPDQALYIAIPTTTGDGGSTTSDTCSFAESHLVSVVALAAGSALLLI